MTAKLEIQHIAHADVDDTQKALISSLKLALVEYLDSNDGVLHHTAGKVRNRRR